MKKLSILIITICLLFSVGCSSKESKEGIVEEGKSTPYINLILISNSKYFIKSEFINEENGDDGYYKQSYKYGNIKFTLERMKHKEYSDFPVYIDSQEIYNLKQNNENINNEIETQLSYPVTKATYMTKIDNEEFFNEDILILTDQWDFRIHLENNINDYDKNLSIIEDIVKHIKIEEVS